MKIALITLFAFALVLAEPPVPSNQYIPANTYLGPKLSTPASTYGAPAQTEAILKPSSSYGPPTNTYIPPSNSYGPPSNTYGPPSNTYGPPSNTYGPPSNTYGPPSNTYGPPGYGGRDEEESEPANYQFSYHVEDAASGNDFGHEEERQGDVAKGKYFVLLPDGRRQTVEYTADLDGYKPKVTYEQVGGYPSGGPNGYPASNGGYQY
ncbi:pro-resilin-like [Diorhabda carinulata]|uniref:pro-resilin-like n=1 Tax=Diorhabda carinulata TaxID=1163345 RepID=UPI0025A22BCF|nr:pro-resilin-like [Diorhabda carinulata]